MNTKTLTDHALSVIDQYVHFRFGPAVCSVPYFNNRTARSRAAFRSHIGKGSPREIFDEVETVIVRDRLDRTALTDQTLKKIMVDNNIGIECSGFAYYVLNAQSRETGGHDLSSKLSFPYCRGIVGKLRCSLRPVENCNVATLAHDKNSHRIFISDARPGDIITMISDISSSEKTAGEPSISYERDHILVIHQIEYQNFIPVRLHYSHAIAYPEDGLLGSGVRQGTIEIADPGKTLTDGIWEENGKTGEQNRLFIRARNSVTGLRRLNWM